MFAQWKRFSRDESGATAIEYGLIAAAMGLMLVAIMPQFAGSIKAVFSDIIYSKVLQNALN